MKIITYMCENCFEPHIFNPNNDNDEFLCQKCGSQMTYWATEEIDPITNKVINRCNEDTKMIEYSASSQQCIPKCPICSSTDLSKISAIKKATKIGLFGIFGAGDVGKTYKCNNCGSKF